MIAASEELSVTSQRTSFEWESFGNITAPTETTIWSAKYPGTPAKGPVPIAVQSTTHNLRSRSKWGHAMHSGAGELYKQGVVCSRVLETSPINAENIVANHLSGRPSSRMTHRASGPLPFPWLSDMNGDAPKSVKLRAIASSWGDTIGATGMPSVRKVA